MWLGIVLFVTNVKGLVILQDIAKLKHQQPHLFRTDQCSKATGTHHCSSTTTPSRIVQLRDSSNLDYYHILLYQVDLGNNQLKIKEVVRKAVCLPLVPKKLARIRESSLVLFFLMINMPLFYLTPEQSVALFP
jgi:hypothetical protein